MRQFTVSFVFCCFLGCVFSLSIDQVDVAAIKGARDKVPPEEILTLINPLITKRQLWSSTSVLNHKLLNLISDLGYTSHSTGKNYTIGTSMLNWYDAWTSCKRRGLEFANVTTAEDQIQLVKQLVAGGWTASSYNRFWLAATNGPLYSGGDWVWVSDSCSCTLTDNSTALDFSYWGPSNPDSVINNNCLAAYGPSGGLWYNYACNNVFYYICQ